MIVVEQSARHENRDLQLPADEDEQEKFIRAMNIKNYALIFGPDDENVPFGSDCIVRKQVNNEKQNSAQLRSVPQFMAVFKLMCYVCQLSPNQIIMTSFA